MVGFAFAFAFFLLFDGFSGGCSTMDVEKYGVMVVVGRGEYNGGFLAEFLLSSDEARAVVRLTFYLPSSPVLYCYCYCQPNTAPFLKQQTKQVYSLSLLLHPIIRASGVL